MRRFLITFFLFNLVLTSFYLDVWKNANTTSRALPIITYFESGTFRIDKYHELTVDKAYVNGHYYTDKAPLPTYLVLPFFGLLHETGVIQADGSGNLFGDHIYMLGAFLTASLPFALFVVFVFLKIHKIPGKFSPVLLASIPLYGSFLFVFTGTYFAHILSALLLLASYLLIGRKHFFMAGVLGGLAFLSEFNLAVILFLWGGWIVINERNFKSIIQFSAGILPALIFILVYNSIFSTSPFTFMYKHHNFAELDTNYGFVIPGAEPFWGLTFSPYRGIFFYTPFLLIGLLVVYRMIRRRQLLPFLKSYLSIPFLLYFIFIASYFAWWGGWTYGPRLLLAMILILLYELILYLSKNPIPKSVFGVLALFGLLVTLPAKGSIAYSAPTGVYNPFIELVLGGIAQGDFNPNNLLTLYFGLNAGTSFFLFLATFIVGFAIFHFWYTRWQTH